MTYQELKIALDIGDPNDVLANVCSHFCNQGRIVLCDDGDFHLFDKDGNELSLDYATGIRAIYSNAGKLTVKTVMIPDSVECLDVNSFRRCGCLERVQLGRNVTDISWYAFYRCSKLKDVVFNGNLKHIGVGAFEYCSSLESIDIPDSIASISTDAFANCSNLADVKIGSGIWNIGYLAFAGCSSLKRILFKGKTIEQVKAMENYPWGIEDESIIQTEL